MRSYALFSKMVVGVISFLLLCGSAGAAGFPDRAIQVLVGWGAGSGNDVVDRAIATSLSRVLKQPVIVQNVPGGAGGLVLGRVKTEKPDGYTLFQTGTLVYALRPLEHAVPWDPMKDFAYLATHAKPEHYMACLSNKPWKTFKDVIQYVKKHPREVSYSTAGVGTAQHLQMEYIAKQEKLQWVHVPYNGNSEIIAALLGGHTDLALLTSGTEKSYIQTGRMRPLLCVNGQRMKSLPDVPTILEEGYDFPMENTWIWSVPVATPKDVQATLEKALLQAIADPQVQEFLKKIDIPYFPVGSKKTAETVVKSFKQYQETMKELGLGIYKK